MKHDGYFVNFGAELFQGVFEVLKALDVFADFPPIGINDEDDAIRIAQRKFARGIEDDIAGDGEKLESYFKIFEQGGISRDKVEKKRGVRAAFQRFQFAYMGSIESG